MSATMLLAVVGLIGIGSQWLAWRFRIPAIIFLLCAGLVVGPVTGWMRPSVVLGNLVHPLIGLAVAIILFEGGLSLDFRGLRDASQAVRRIIIVASPLTWALITLAAHFLAELSWPSAAVLGGILTVTGPTVVQPLLQGAKMQPRPSAVLRWEAIVNDPIGALFAVLAYEVFVQLQSGDSLWGVALKLVVYILASGIIGFVAARVLGAAFRSVHVPEFLKVPSIFVCVIAAFVAGNALLDEAGLLTVMVMGITLGNMRLASLTEIRRFKEHAAVLLVSGVFVLLTSDVDAAIVKLLDWHSALFIGLLLIAIRPLVISLSTIGSNLTWRETLLISWVAPRGVVAVATAAVFGTALSQHGAVDGDKIPALVFTFVLASVLLYGLSAGAVARALKLASSAPPGLMLVGANAWTIALAEALKAMEVPVLIADREWVPLKAARAAGFPTYYGEILAEAADHQVDHALFDQVIAATDSHSYNTLVCTDLGPQFGRQHVFQVGRRESDEHDPQEIALSLGGRTLMDAGFDLQALLERLRDGWVFRKTTLTEAFDFAAYAKTLSPGAQILLARTARGVLHFAVAGTKLSAEEGETVLAFVPEASGQATAAVAV